ncbi:uncharacterized protein LOC106761967 isoform X2 [Vigna radiata var. radiata]|uniref:Uncharacterized protein LOC106761967 isoform X2 n=1 Tax=Vigna radiata var. radiata TaxID=3916 RepID=A0A1S3U4Z5_VIGRR|nr:uncharacterized protein LOC106761967 isoform X2 [Vigna radiata var. radiata]
MASSNDIDSSNNKLYVRHSMKTKYVAGLNALLIEEHRCIISKTPFKWFLDLQDNLRIGMNILSDLLTKWIDERGGFLFGENFVQFKEVDVTLSLGLSLVGDKINLNEKNLLESHCRNYFDKEKGKGKYKLDVIYDFVLKNHKKLPAIDVCRLYLFIGIHEILLPSCSRTIFPILFEIVDRINDLGTFCWAPLVYHYLLSSFCKQNLSWKRGKGATNFYVDGCIYVFQVWFCDRFIPSNACVHKYPRILHWMSVSVGDKFIKVAMETGVMLDEYGASRKEMGESSVKASVHRNVEDVKKGKKSKNRKK